MNKPFSERLNNWIYKRLEGIQYEIITNEYDFRYLYNMYRINNRLLVNSNHCDNTIFGSKQNNIYFRVWHDLIHFQNNLDFSFENECEVAFLQCSELPDDWNYEKMLIISDVIGQGLYFEKYNKFVDNQIDFTNELLKTGKI